ncbi:hypothetical protein GIB67_022339 [Kingdonia uniflora]|uniref:Uncharacterized protein n=1 Tax=Kingdonia uniflora TaxID=39325 RepID=A0A7J7MIK0_9MAGN|nr:hypothetical protein GIB67_022339 [Kingdonia uniflora]
MLILGCKYFLSLPCIFTSLGFGVLEYEDSLGIQGRKVRRYRRCNLRIQARKVQRYRRCN